MSAPPVILPNAVTTQYPGMYYPYKYPEPYKPKGRSSYVFDYRDRDGTRKRRNTNRTTKKEAYFVIRTFLDELYNPDINAAIQRMTFREYAEPYFIEGKCPRIERLRGEKKIGGEYHAERSRDWLERFVFSDPFAEIPLGEIRRRDILDLRSRKLEESGGQKVNTANKVVDTVKAILSEAYLREDIDRNPGHRIGKLSYAQEEVGILNPKQMQDLFRVRPGHFDNELAYDLFYLAAFTGMRSGECRALPYGNTLLNDKAVLIHQAWKDNTCKTLGPPKWGKKRDIPISDSLVQLISSNYFVDSFPPERFLFHREEGKPLGPTWWRKNFYNALTSLGVVERVVSSEKYTTSNGRNPAPKSLQVSPQSQDPRSNLIPSGTA
jgi:integrase